MVARLVYIYRIGLLGHYIQDRVARLIYMYRIELLG